MRLAPGTRHRTLVLIAVAIAAVLLAIGLFWDAPPLVQSAPPAQ